MVVAVTIVREVVKAAVQAEIVMAIAPEVVRKLAPELQAAEAEIVIPIVPVFVRIPVPELAPDLVWILAPKPIQAAPVVAADIVQVNVPQIVTVPATTNALKVAQAQPQPPAAAIVRERVIITVAADPAKIAPLHAIAAASTDVSEVV